MKRVNLFILSLHQFLQLSSENSYTHVAITLVRTTTYKTLLEIEIL